MPLKHRRRKRWKNDSLMELITRSDRFIMKTIATYVHRHLSYCSNLNGKIYDTLLGVLEENGLYILDRALERWDDLDGGNYEEVISQCNEDSTWFLEAVD